MFYITKNKTYLSSIIFYLSSNYQKKLGLIRRRITPDAQRIAKPIATLTIISLPHLGLPVAIIMPATMISTNAKISMTLIKSLTKADTKIGKAVVSVIIEPEA